VMSRERRNITESFNENQTTNTSYLGTNQMSEVDRRKFQETMEGASTTFQAVFYQVASFGGSIVALFIFSTAVASEIRKGTIRLTLSKPVSRTQFLLGKYLGGVAVMASYAVIAGLAIVVFTQSQSLDLNPAIKWSPWLMFCEQLTLGSVAL